MLNTNREGITAMNTIYDLHAAAFNQVSAYVLTNKNGERVATIAFKFPEDGAGRLYCYLHLIGLEMVREYAGGYGYDKKSSAVQHAISKLLEKNPKDKDAIKLASLKQAMDAGDWQRVLEDAGFNVLQAV